MRQITVACLTAAAVVAAGCVIRTQHTIDAHVTVDIRQVDAQAEDIVSYVTGETDALSPEASRPAPETAPGPTGSLWRALDSLAPLQVAYAAELKESSPKVKELADKLRARNAEIQAYKARACLGENNRGYVELLPCDEFKDAAKKNEAQRIVAAENQDRKALYREIADLNKDQNVTLSVVERIFAAKWRAQARAGERVQLPPKGPEFDEFLKTPLAKKLGDEAKPDAWVTVK
jgi:uncharacterized protein YdbL (DUF1318 family)